MSIWMPEYHKVQSVYQRDMNLRHRPLIEGAWSTPELAYLADSEWTWTEKVDGTNIRIGFRDGRLTFAGRTNASSVPSLLIARLNERLLPQLDRMTERYPDGVVLYGEGYGAKIQKLGAEYRADQDVVLFDVRVGDWWLSRESVEDVAAFLGFDVVPVIGTGTLGEAIAKTREGFDSVWGPFRAEGIVARPAGDLFTRSGGRIITKVKHTDFRVVG